MCSSITEKQDKLRKQRDELQKEVNAIQNRIDELEIEKYNADKYLNCYIKTEIGNTINIMYVKKITRLSSGPKFTGPVVEYHSYLKGNNIVSLYTEYSISSIPWKNLGSRITIITKEEAVKLVNKYIEFVNFFK
ncbi:hypothetical protein [Intestinibacter sp.]|uniref:hypothetical protein n=1 Tax=Intestinibacter sp. TaxID=1965304 RepID=UPI003F17570C